MFAVLPTGYRNSLCYKVSSQFNLSTHKKRRQNAKIIEIFKLEHISSRPINLPPISCATDFTGVGERKVQGRNLHNNDNNNTAAVQQVIFHQTNFSELMLQG